MPRLPAERSRDRAIRLFTFLKRISELRAKRVQSIDEYEQVLWIAEMPQDPGCHTIWSERAAADNWIEVTKPRLKEPPAPPPALEPWVDRNLLADSAHGPPELYEKIPAADAKRPGGARRDAESIAAADAAGIAMVFTGVRHFKH